MKATKKILALLLTAVMIFSTSCSTAKKEESSSKVTSSSQVSTFPITITDAAGRNVKIDKKPSKIVSGYYITSSMLIALGISDNVVGIEAKAKTRPIYSIAAEKMVTLPNVGTAKAFDLEGCAKLSPDLVILPLKLKDSASALEGLNIPVILVNPENKEDLMKTIDIVGKVTGTAEKAEALEKAINDQYKTLESKLDSVSKTKVYIGGNSDILSTAGAKMYQSDMIEVAGATNVAKELTDNYWAKTSYEQIATWNPDAIIIASDATYKVEDVLNDKNLENVNAVKNKKVFQMPGSVEAWDSPVPSTVLGSLYVASVLHSDKYTEEEYKKASQGFYKQFYNVDIQDKLS